MTELYREAMAALLAGRLLEDPVAQGLMDCLMGGQLTDTQAAAVLTALQMRGVHPSELTAFARSMRAHMRPVPASGPVLDTCGTGGSGLSTINTSTMAAFVVAGAGVRVAKHGNRASSGKCGSSDLLAALGVPLELPADRLPTVLEEVGLVFLFAPAHHPAMRHVVPIRRALGFRTVFNLLGPLCNPAGADHQLLGVSDPSQAPAMIRALAALGSRRVVVVHGEDGLDEISLAAPTRTWTLVDGEIAEGRIDPRELGLDLVPHDQLCGGDVERNRQICEQVLSGEDDGPHTRLVLLNAAAALQVAGTVADLTDGYRLAEESLRGGRARRVLERYRQVTEGVRAAAS